MSVYDIVQPGADKPYADASAVKAVMALIGVVRVPFQINQTDLLAPTAQNLVSPIRGKISKLVVVVTVQVTTGGPITVKRGADVVTGLAVTVADGAVVGTVYSDTPTSDGTDDVNENGRIQIVPDALFATAGAVNGYVEITPV